MKPRGCYAAWAIRGPGCHLFFTPREHPRGEPRNLSGEIPLWLKKPHSGRYETRIPFGDSVGSPVWVRNSLFKAAIHEL
jgi:hypothetical protein